MILCYFAETIQNESQKRYYKNNLFKSEYFSSIDKMDFWLYFKLITDPREREVIFINDLPPIFEDCFSIAVINSFDLLYNFGTDRNEVILINTGSTSIPDYFHKDSFEYIKVNNILYELRCRISFSNIDYDSTKMAWTD